MSDDEARLVAAAALRNLNHAFAAHDPDAMQLRALTEIADAEVAHLQATPDRDRLALMQGGVDDTGLPSMHGGAGFADRAVAGGTNPTSLDFEVRFENDEVIAVVVLRPAFEGAPGRAHGGIVAAAFDEVTGYVIGMMRQPAFTGELTVRYLAPVPMNEELVMRARLDSRERRKLFISGEAHHGEHLVATCHAIYITVDPAVFARAPDPR